MSGIFIVNSINLGVLVCKVHILKRLHMYCSFHADICYIKQLWEMWNIKMNITLYVQIKQVI